MKIRKLTQEIINKISAGEVIERPASVVKELIENSIDAGATEIFVNVKGSGKEEIAVADNGSGMDKDDLFLSVDSHTTSKLPDLDMLYHVNTLGFRGEALASVAAVSELAITTRQTGAVEGHRLEITNGRKQLVSSSSRKGTEVVVRNLFFNTPVRKKFLKSDKTELAAIIDVVSRYALIRKDIFFRLMHDSKEVLVCPIAANHIDRIAAIYGSDMAKELCPVEFSSGRMKIAGYISKPATSRGDRQHISTYINQRYIKNQTITNGLIDSYHTLLMTQRYPIAVLDITIPAGDVDVNVHPSKETAKLADEGVIYNLVFDAVRDCFSKSSLIAEPEVTGEVYDNRRIVQKVLAPVRQMALEVREAETTAGEIQILGQVYYTYILARTKEGFMIIDQHASQERYNYESLMLSYSKENIKVQELLEPMLFELGPADAMLVKEHLAEFAAFGLNLEEFGQNTFRLGSVPVVAGRQMLREGLYDILEEINESKPKTLDEIREKIITRMACRFSVKAHRLLTDTEMLQIVLDLFSCDLPYTCPHGRPTMIVFSEYELEKRFKRVV